MIDAMRHLLVLRHAKSEWGPHGLPDHERPLAARGTRAAPQIAAWIDEQGYRPDLVLCSTAVRTRQTLELLGSAVEESTVEIEHDLYLAGWPQLLDRLRQLGTRFERVLLVGHNPGLQQLVCALARQGSTRERAERKFPTAALAVLALPCASWNELSPGNGELVDFVVPADLERS